ncbi:MAG: PLP-dependent transferase [Luteolibacter sp.]
MTRDLLTEPAWQEQDMGLPMPDSAHACSVCLPTWDSIIGYEEKRAKVMKRLRAGYPRFFKHPSVVRLFENARSEVATEQEEVLVLPSRSSAHRAQRWIENRAEVAARVTSYHGLQALIVPAQAKSEADAYWRFSGEVISSRQARDFLDGKLREESKSHLVERQLAKLLGPSAASVAVFSSGMAAITAVVRALPGIAQGKKSLQIEFPYVDSLKTQELLGAGVAYLNRADGEAFDEALQRIRQGEFAGVFTEVPSNPLLRTIDLARVAAACTDGATPLIVDDSAAGNINVDALRFADVLTSSLTKWISGHGDVMAGMAAVRANSPFAAEFTATLQAEATEHAPLYVGDAEILISHMKGYAERMRVVNQTGELLAAWLADHPAVEHVWHPSIETRENYDAVRRKDGGYGGLLSFVLKNGKKTSKVYDWLPLCKGPGFGTPFTLVCAYPMLAHYHELDWVEACGVSPNLLRLSCGLEPIDVIQKALAEALSHA